jgi:hypothetical protein
MTDREPRAGEQSQAFEALRREHETLSQKYEELMAFAEEQSRAPDGPRHAAPPGARRKRHLWIVPGLAPGAILAGLWRKVALHPVTASALTTAASAAIVASVLASPPVAGTRFHSLPSGPVPHHATTISPSPATGTQSGRPARAAQDATTARSDSSDPAMLPPIVIPTPTVEPSPLPVPAPSFRKCLHLRQTAVCVGKVKTPSLLPSPSLDAG